MAIAIKEFSAFSPTDLYVLFQDVYSTADGMSEILEDKYPTLAAFEEGIAALQSLPGAVALAAESNGQPVAFLTISPRRQAKLRHTADLAMGVAESARCSGTGGALLQKWLDLTVASRTIEIVYLMVRSDNIPAIRLYSKHGFELLATLHRDTRIGDTYFDGMLMRRFMER